MSTIPAGSADYILDQLRNINITYDDDNYVDYDSDLDVRNYTGPICETDKNEDEIEILPKIIQYDYHNKCKNPNYTISKYHCMKHLSNIIEYSIKHQNVDILFVDLMNLCIDCDFIPDMEFLHYHLYMKIYKYLKINKLVFDSKCVNLIETVVNSLRTHRANLLHGRLKRLTSGIYKD